MWINAFSWWIEKLVKDKTFVDVGGVWNTTNEKVTEASLAGASEVTMIDAMKDKSHWWDKFDKRCKEKGVVCKNKISMNINEPSLLEQIGTFDVVHCAGVLYHCPNPIYTLNQLYSITNDYLIFGTTRIPSNLEDMRFLIDVPEGGILLSEALTEKQKEICMNFYGLEGSSIFYDGIEDEFIQYRGKSNTNPWWYFFTDGYVEYILKACGFNILQKDYYWKIENSNCAVYYVTEKVK
jgi:hypothetical protein